MDGRTKTGKKKDFRLTHSKETVCKDSWKGNFLVGLRLDSWQNFLYRKDIHVFIWNLIWCTPQALQKNVHTLDLYNQLPNSFSESTSSGSSSSEECTGRPQQVPVEEEKTPQKQLTLAAARPNPKGERRKCTRKPSERRFWPGAWTYFVTLNSFPRWDSSWANYSDLFPRREFPQMVVNCKGVFQNHLNSGLGTIVICPGWCSLENSSQRWFN